MRRATGLLDTHFGLSGFAVGRGKRVSTQFSMGETNDVAPYSLALVESLLCFAICVFLAALPYLPEVFWWTRMASRTQYDGLKQRRKDCVLQGILLSGGVTSFKIACIVKVQWERRAEPPILGRPRSEMSNGLVAGGGKKGIPMPTPFASSR